MEILNGRVYKHFKGGYSLVLFTAKHSDRDEIEVVYKGLNNGKIYARPMDSFIEIVKNAEGKDTPRFSLATKEEVETLLSVEELEQIKSLTAFIEKEPNTKNI